MARRKKTDEETETFSQEEVDPNEIISIWREDIGYLKVSRREFETIRKDQGYVEQADPLDVDGSE